MEELMKVKQELFLTCSASIPFLEIFSHRAVGMETVCLFSHHRFSATFLKESERLDLEITNFVTSYQGRPSKIRFFSCNRALNTFFI